MVYEWLYPLRDLFHAFNVFRYVTFRAMYAALFALALSFLLGKWVIARLKAMKVAQPVRQDGPQTHLKKSGTPTMGGVLILFALLVSTLVWARWDNPYVWLLCASAVWFGGIGAWDDLAKLRARRSEGLSVRGKLGLQLLGAGALMLAYYHFVPGVAQGTVLNLPFFKQPLALPLWGHAAIAVLVIVFICNAVNLTDGLDGLAAGTSAMASMVFVVVAYLAGHFKLAEYLHIPFVQGMSEGAVVMAGVFGACLGFLWFNAYPAGVFMGDTGSLALGGVFGTVAVFSRQEYQLAIVGGIFVIEALSVMIQVTSFKLRGKRVFKMAPLHHHFELHGWDEPKVIVRFWIVAIVLVLIALSTLKLR